MTRGAPTAADPGLRIALLQLSGSGYDLSLIHI